MKSESPRLRAGCFLVATACLVSSGSALAATHQVCGGQPIPGTAEELAATPRGDDWMELLALDMGTAFLADEGLYQRLVADQEQLSTLFPNPETGIPYLPRHDGKTVLIGFDAPTYASVRAGTYHDWDCLNEWYGLEHITYWDFIQGVAVELEGIYDIPQLVPFYESLPGVAYAEENGYGSVGPPSTTCVLGHDGGTFHYFVTDGTGALGGGCGRGICAFSTTPDAPPRYRGLWAGSEEAPWTDLAKACLDGGSRRLALDLDLAPEHLFEGGEVVLDIEGRALAIDGLGAVCGGDLESITVDPQDGTIEVVAEPVLGCLISPPPAFSIEAPLGALDAGEHLLTVAFAPAQPGDPPLVEGATWIEVRSADETAAACPGNGPGATLLVPYFEVDLASPAGRTTFFSVANASPEPTLARVVLWTNRGFPSYGATIEVPGDGIVPVNLRQLFESGKFPGTGGLGPDPPAGCEAGLTEAERLDLVARHTGVEDSEGWCYSGQGYDGHLAAEPALAVGYATVDVVNHATPEDCSVRFPGDDGYFEMGGSGLASNRNVLWGDVYYLDGGESSAQGIAAIALRADDALVDFPDTFYRGWVGGSGADQRRPLASLYRSRFLEGGGLGMTTDLLVWTEGHGAAIGARLCGWTAEDPESALRLRATLRDEAGRAIGADEVELRDRVDRLHAWEIVQALQGIEPPPAIFGQIDLSVAAACTSCTNGEVFERRSLQSVAIPVLAAGGRYSLSVAATRLGGGCP